LRLASEKEDAPYWYGYSINFIKPWARKSPSQGPGYHNAPPLEDQRPRQSTPIQEPPLLATSVCLVSSYAMPCDHSGPTCAMRHIPEPPSPHTPVKPRGPAPIPAVAEPPELFQLKCLSHASGAVTHLNRNNPSVPQI
jgi:hypothetical protein